MQVTGIVKLIGQTQEVGQRGFKKRQIVLTTDEQYPQDIPIDFVQDKVNMLDLIAIGQKLTIAINLRGNEYNGKYYVNLQGWQVTNG